MRKEVIANKEAQEHEIINQTFKIRSKRRIRNLQVILQIFSQYPNVEELQECINKIIQ